MVAIGLVDDHAIVRRGLRELLSAEVDFCIAGEAASGREAIELTRSAALNVLIMDIAMPGQSGLDVIDSIRIKHPGVGILIFTGLSEKQYAVSLLRKGASGFLNKDCDPLEISRAVRLIAMGNRYVTPRLGELLAHEFSSPSDGTAHQLLTNREFQVLLKLSQGSRVTDVARDMCLTVKTVSGYRSSVMKKMQLESNSDLTYYALKNHLIE